MTLEYITLCVAVVLLCAGLLAALARLDRVEGERATAIDERDAARVCRDRLRTLHKLDPDADWDQRVTDLERQLADTVGLLQAETQRRVAAEHMRDVALGELVLKATLATDAAYEHVEADPAGEMPRPRPVPVERWGI